MSYDITHARKCEDCQGSGLVYRVLKGGNVKHTARCNTCFGTGTVWRRMTSEEKQDLARELLKDEHEAKTTT